MDTTEIMSDIGEGLQQVMPVFETYQKARLQFAQSLADFASKPTANIAVREAGAVPLLCSLIFDVVPAIQRTALLALGRLCSHNEQIAEEIVKKNLLPLLISRLQQENLTNITVQAGSIPKIVEYIQNHEGHDRLPGVMFLGTLATKSDDMANDVILGKILKVDGKARSRFITSGTFRRVQQLNPEVDSETERTIQSINNCFPPELIHYYTSGYLEELLKQVENFQPPPDPYLESK